MFLPVRKTRIGLVVVGQSGKLNRRKILTHANLCSFVSKENNKTYGKIIVNA